jgi:hypothetical protein
MATFTQDTLKSQKARDPRELEEAVGDIERGVQAAQRRQGGVITKLDEFEKAPIWDKYLAGEQARREAAAPGAAGIAGQIDERLAGATNQLQTVYDKYNQSAADLQQKQAQNTLLTDFEKEQGLWNISNQREQLDFQLFKNQAQRDDAIESLWKQGIAEDKLLDMSINHNLKLQDIDKYFTLKINEIEQEFQDWRTKTEADWNKKIAEWKADASNWGSIIGGLFGVAGGVVGTMYGGPAGGVAGSMAGSKLGEGVAGVTA